MSKLPLQIVLIKMEYSHLICILTYLIYFNVFINRYICIKNKKGSHFLNWQRTGTTKCCFDSCSYHKHRHPYLGGFLADGQKLSVIDFKNKSHVFFVLLFLNNMLSDRTVDSMKPKASVQLAQ